MIPLPATDQRSNRATWAVPAALVPTIAYRLTELLPLEVFDPAYQGQELETTYFDTCDFRLRKARVKGSKYMTLRLRHYGSTDTYALSAKTEASKVRFEIGPDQARWLLSQGASSAAALSLPPEMLARLLALVDEAPLVPVITVCCRRYAVEDDQDRLTFDWHITTDLGKCLPYGVLEHKSTNVEASYHQVFAGLGLRPIKLSKFLWATSIGGVS